MVQHKILFLPDLISFLIIILLGWLALSFTGIIPVIQQMPAMPTDEEMAQIVVTFLQDHLGKLIGGILGFVFASFVVGSATLAAKFGLIRQILSRKEASSQIAWTWGRAYLWKVVSMRIAAFLLYLGSAIVSAIIFILLRQINESLAIIITLVIILTTTVYLLLGLFMRYPAMYKKNLPVRDAINTAFVFFIRNKKCVVITAFIIAATTLIIRQVFDIIMMMGIAWSGKAAAIVAVIMSLVMLLAMIGVGIFGDLYTFQIYETVKGKK